MTVEATRTGPPPPPPAPRRTKPRVTLWRPDNGQPELVEAHHVSDLIRINGWSRRDPSTVSETPPASVTEEIAGEILAPADFADAPAEPRAPLPIVDALRAEITTLGGTYDERAGIASLTSIRNELRATQSNKGDTTDYGKQV